MARKVIWTESAWCDLAEVADYISKDSPYYAATFIQEVKTVARSLESLTERGRIVPELGDPTFNELFVKSYRLIYHYSDDNVYIVGFIHGARDLLKLWEQESRSPF